MNLWLELCNSVGQRTALESQGQGPKVPGNARDLKLHFFAIFTHILYKTVP